MNKKYNNGRDLAKVHTKWMSFLSLLELDDFRKVRRHIIAIEKIIFKVVK